MKELMKLGCLEAQLISKRIHALNLMKHPVLLTKQIRKVHVTIEYVITKKI